MRYRIVEPNSPTIKHTIGTIAFDGFRDAVLNGADPLRAFIEQSVQQKVAQTFLNSVLDQYLALMTPAFDQNIGGVFANGARPDIFTNFTISGRLADLAIQNHQAFELNWKTALKPRSESERNSQVVEGIYSELTYKGSIPEWSRGYREVETVEAIYVLPPFWMANWQYESNRAPNLIFNTNNEFGYHDNVNEGLRRVLEGHANQTQLHAFLNQEYEPSELVIFSRGALVHSLLSHVFPHNSTFC